MSNGITIIIICQDPSLRGLIMTMNVLVFAVTEPYVCTKIIAIAPFFMLCLDLISVLFYCSLLIFLADMLAEATHLARLPSEGRRCY